MTEDVADRQNGLELLREAVTETYGERCDEDEPGCVICDAWRAVDEYEASAKAIAMLEAAISDAMKQLTAAQRDLLAMECPE